MWLSSAVKLKQNNKVNIQNNMIDILLNHGSPEEYTY